MSRPTRLTQARIKELLSECAEELAYARSRGMGLWVKAYQNRIDRLLEKLPTAPVHSLPPYDPNSMTHLTPRTDG